MKCLGPNSTISKTSFSEPSNLEAIANSYAIYIIM